MNGGLNISINEFKSIKNSDKLDLLFENIVYIRTSLSDYKIHKKIQYVWLVVLTAFVAPFIGIRKLMGL